MIIRRLCDTNMSDKQHDLTESLLRIWHKDLEVLYGDKNMTFTAHAHLHLVDQVKRLGPLNKLEAFCFEGFLKHIKDKVNGTRYIGATIVKRIILEQNCIKKVLEIQVPHIQDYAADHLLPKVYKKDASSDDNIRSSSEKLNLVEANVLKSFDKSITNVSIIECFSRLKLKNLVYTVSSYDSEHKRSNSYAKWVNDECTYYGIIEKLIIVKNEKLFIARQFEVLNLQETLKISSKYKQAFDICRLDDYFTIVSNYNFTYTCLPATFLKANCIYVQIPNAMYGIITEVFDFQHD